MGLLSQKNIGRAVLRCVVLSGLMFLFRPEAFAVRSIRLEWVPCDSPEVVGYNVHYGNVSGHYNHSAFVSLANATILGLIEEQTYYFTVRSVSDAGVESNPSNEVSYKVPTAPSGTFYGLLYDAERVRADNAGSLFTVSSTPGRTYSGQIRIGAARYSFSGVMDENYHASNLINRKGASPLTLGLTFGSGGQAAEIVSGFLTDGVWTSFVFGRLVETNAAGYAGTYTLVLPGPATNSEVPNGDGFGTVLVTPQGGIRFAGSLSDGTKLTFSGLLCRQRQWPLYIPLYSGQGLILGWIGFADLATSDLSGTLAWLKPQSFQAAANANGFTYEIPAVGSFFNPNLSNYVNRPMQFRASGSTGEFTNLLSVASNGKLVGTTNGGFDLTITLSQGLFKGKVVDPAARVSRPFRGALLQKTATGYGTLFGADQSGFIIEPVARRLKKPAPVDQSSIEVSDPVLSAEH
jgi:hypothetical protein